MPIRLSPTFRDVLAGADRSLAGMWVSTGSPLVAEICAGSGLDWLLIDMEHGPNGLESVLAQLQAVAAYPITPGGVVELFREYYGPSVRTFASLDAARRGIRDGRRIARARLRELA